MSNDLEVVGEKLGLTKIFKDYGDLEKNFGDVIWESIGHHFPEDFDKKLLNLNDIIANIKLNGDNAVSLSRIPNDLYDGNIVELYDKIRHLNGLLLDGFKVEVQGFNLDDDEPTSHLVNIRFRKVDETIEGDFTVGKDEGVLESALEVLELDNTKA